MAGRDGLRVGLHGAWEFLSAVNEGWASISKVQRDYLVALHDVSIQLVDAAIGALFEDFKGRGLYDRALIVVAADHGEDLCDPYSSQTGYPPGAGPQGARLHIWHVAPGLGDRAGKGAAAKELSSEEMGQMEALGYLGD